MIPDLSPLADSFAHEVTKGERGAICVMYQGRVLLNLNGGDAAPGQPWQDDTLACCFSVSKGVLSILAHVMIDRGMIALDTPVAAVWPEFGQNGKEKITLLDILTHRAGLPAVGHPVTAGDLYDWDRMVQHLERSAPMLSPHGKPVYHNMTYGHLLGQTLCRAASQPSLPLLLRELVTSPLAVDFRIGPHTTESTHIAELTQDNPGALFRSLTDTPDTLFARSMAFFDPTEDFNSLRWRSAVIGSGSGHATAKALATLYGQLIWDDAILTPGRQKAARTIQSWGFRSDWVKVLNLQRHRGSTSAPTPPPPAIGARVAHRRWPTRITGLPLPISLAIWLTAWALHPAQPGLSLPFTPA